MKKLILTFSIIVLFAGTLFAQNVAVGTGFAQRGGAIPGLTYDGEGIVFGSPADSVIFEIPVSVEATITITTMVTTGIVSSGPIDVTVANTTAGGETAVQSQITHATNALTGSLIGVRGNARVDIDSPSGTAIGGKFQAGNSSTGFNMFLVDGAYAEVVNKIPSGAKTWTHTRGLEINMDLNQGSAGNVTTFTNATGLYMVWNLPTVDNYTNVGTGYGILMRNEQVGGNGQMLDAALYVDDLNMGGGVKGWNYGIDFSGMEANFGAADWRMSDGALMNNSTADLLTITEATVDIDGASTATSYASDANITIGGHIDQNGTSGSLDNELADTLNVVGEGTFTTGLDISATAANQIKLPILNDAATPTLAFGGSGTFDTGFYEIAASQIGISAGTVVVGRFSNLGYIAGTGSANSGFVTAAATSSTAPAHSFNLDSDTGLGAAAADAASLIAGGKEGLRVTEDTSIKLRTFGQAVGFAIINNTKIGTLEFFGDDDTGSADEIGGQIETIATGTWTDGAEDAKMVLNVADNGTLNANQLVLNTDGSVQFGFDPVFVGYARSIDISSGQANVGAVAPTATTIATFRGLGFDADGEIAFLDIEVPEDWDGISDMTLKIYYMTTDGDAVQNGETIKLDVDYRSIAEGEAVDNGTVVSITDTYTASGNQTDKELFEQTITIDYNNGNQPLTAGDLVSFLFNRDVSTDTYSGAVIVIRWEVDYTSIGLPVH